VLRHMSAGYIQALGQVGQSIPLHNCHLYSSISHKVIGQQQMNRVTPLAASNQVQYQAQCCSLFPDPYHVY
jgi:hypothetical protein